MRKTFGKRLKYVRETNDMTQKQLSEKSGFTIVSLSRWENGVHSPRKEDIDKLATALGVSVSYLVGETDRAEVAELALPLGRKNYDLNVICIPYIDNDLIESPCDEGDNYPQSVTWKVIYEYTILKDYLRDYDIQSDDKDLAIVSIESDSMEPKIKNGDSILFSKCPETKLKSGDYALIKWHENLTIRGIEFDDIKGKIILTPTNKHSGVIEVKKGDSRLCFIGKVLGKIPQIEKITGMY